MLGSKKYELLRKKSSESVTSSGSGSGFRKSSSGYSHLGCCSAVPYNLAEARAFSLLFIT
jgi:hypothetical protein